MSAAIVYATRADLDDFGGLPDGMLANEGREASSVLASTDTFTLAGHGLFTDSQVTVRAVAGGALPAPLAASTIYYAIRVSDDTFKLSATAGGSAINLTTDGTSVIVTKELPIDRYLEAFSRWVEDCLPAHLVPLERDENGKYPILIVMLVCQLAGKALLNRGGKDSEVVKAAAVEAKAQLDRWAAGRPLRDPGITASAQLAIVSTLASTADPRGYGSGSLP